MSKARVTSLIVLCAALAACSDGVTNPTLTAPDARRDISEVPAGLGAAYTVDGPLESGFASDEATAQAAGAQRLGAQIAASSRIPIGSRAFGHVGFPTGVLPPGTGLASESYSFVALRTDPATPDAAKGEFEVKYTTTTGVDIKIHGDVVCLNVFGNNARVGGQITKVWRDGVKTPITANTHAFWVVVDSGEGRKSPPDQVSLMRFSNAATTQFYCANGFLSFVFPIQQGNIWVR